MKVIVSGAQSVGKTTLLDNMNEIYKPLIVKEQIREAVRNNSDIKHDLETDDRSQRIFFDMYMDLFYSNRKYISDRGMLDVVAYTKYFVLTGNCSNECYQKMMQEFMKIDKSDVTYVYIPIEFPATEDGFRNTKEEYRRGVNRCLCEVMSESQIEPFVLTGSMLNRKTQFDNLLDSLNYHENIL